METKDILEEFQQVVIATLDVDKKPITNVISLISYENTIGFVVGKETDLYHQLMEQGYVSLFGLKNQKSIRINGNVLKDENQQGLFYVEEGEGQYIDSTDKNQVIEEIFSLGKDEIPDGGYYVTSACILCGTCYAVCPKLCIDTAKDPVVINQQECVQCGECMQVCPIQAILRK